MHVFPASISCLVEWLVFCLCCDFNEDLQGRVDKYRFIDMSWR